LTEDGQVTDPGNMDARHLGYARSALAGDSMPHGFPYTQYHRWIPLGGGALCVLQYDYSMPYGSPALQGRLPEFQTCATVVLLAPGRRRPSSPPGTSRACSGGTPPCSPPP